MRIPIPVIVSGGQTGADRGALEWAALRGIPHRGWCPKGRRAENGQIPAEFLLQETPTTDYRERTEWNVRDSDATIIFTQTPVLEGGSKLTRELAIKLKKPCLHLPVSSDSARQLRQFLMEHRPSVLNIAGQRGSKSPELAARVRAVLDEVFFPDNEEGSPQQIATDAEARTLQASAHGIAMAEIEKPKPAQDPTRVGRLDLDLQIPYRTGHREKEPLTTYNPPPPYRATDDPENE